MEKTIFKLQNSLEDTSVCNMLLKADSLISASLAVHSNIIEELRITKSENYSKLIMHYCTT